MEHIIAYYPIGEIREERELKDSENLQKIKSPIDQTLPPS